MKKHGGKQHDEVIDLTEARARSNERTDGLTRKSNGQQPPWRAQPSDTIVSRPQVLVDGDGELGDPHELRSALFDHSERVLQARRLELKPARQDRLLGKPEASMRRATVVQTSMTRGR